MIWKRLHGRIECEVLERGQITGRVNVQRFVGRGKFIVVPVNPHAADARADLEYRDIALSFEHVFSGAKACRARADDRNRFSFFGLHRVFCSRISHGSLGAACGSDNRCIDTAAAIAARIGSPKITKRFAQILRATSGHALD